MGSWFKDRFKTYGPEMILDVLEERIVLDATVDQTQQQSQSTDTHSTAVDSASGTAQPAAGGPAGSVAANQPAADHGLHVLIVSSDIEQTDAIVKAAPADTKIITVDAHTDGINEINAKLQSLVASTGQKIETLAVLGHGKDGAIELGPDYLNNGNLVKYVSALQSLGESLTSNAQIEFYGCSIANGADGKALIDQIGAYTNATVFASTNDTGGSEGKDWTLEYSSVSGASMVEIVDTNALADSSVTLVFATSPFGYDDDPSTYNVYWGDIESSDPAGTATTRATETWTFTLTSTQRVSIAAQTVVPNDQSDAYYIDPWLYIRRVNGGGSYTTVANNDDYGGGTLDIDGDGRDDVHVWDTRVVDVSLTAGTYIVEITHYDWGDQRDYGPYTLYSSYRPNTSTGYIPLDLTFQSGVRDPEVISRPIINVNVFQGFETFEYDVSSSFSVVPTDHTLTYSQTNNNTNTLASVAIDPDTGVITFTDDSNITPGSVVTVTVSATDGTYTSPSQSFTFTIKALDVPIAYSERIWVTQNTPITFLVQGYDPGLHADSTVSFAIDSDYYPLHDASLVATGSITHDAATGIYSQQWTYTPTTGYWGPDSFQFTFRTPGGTWSAFALGSGALGQPGGRTSGDIYATNAVEFVDVNNDGFLDVVEGNYGQLNRYYLNNGTGKFAAGVALGTDTSNTRAIAYGDINHDGWMDVVAGNDSQYDMVYINQGADSSGNWLGFKVGEQIPGTNTGQEYAIALGDLNGDGYVDLVRGNADIADRVHLNDQHGNFDSGTNITSTLTGNTRALALGDLNRDGYLDLVAGKYGANKDLYFLGKGDGTFQTAQTLGSTAATNDSTDAIALGDINNDGWLDVVTGNYDGRPRVYLNSGSGTFTTQANLGNNVTPNTTSIRLADVDRDGDLDAILGNYGENATYYLGTGSGTFADATNVASLSVNTRSIAVGDINGDHAVDVFYGINGAVDRIALNQGFATGTSATQVSAPAVVNINVSLLADPTFGQDLPVSGSSTAPGYQLANGTGWTLYEDPTVNAFGSAFGVVKNEGNISFYTSQHDYYNGADELQMSMGLLGQPFKIKDSDANRSEYVAVLMGNHSHHARIYQDVVIPADSSLADVELHWKMAYQNDYYLLDSAAPFSANQYIAVYVYVNSPVPGTKPAPVWISTNGVDQAVVSTMQDYFISFADSGVTIPKTSSVTIRVEFELVAQNFFFEVALDDFMLVPVKHTAGSAPPATFLSTMAADSALLADTATTTTVAATTLAAQAVDSGLTTLTSLSTSPVSSDISVISSLESNTTSASTLSSLLSSSIALSPTSTGTDTTLEEDPTFLVLDTVSTDSESGTTTTTTVDNLPLAATDPDQDILLAFNVDSSADADHDDAQDVKSADLPLQAAAYDQAVPAGKDSDLLYGNFDPRVALVLDPSRISALQVLDGPAIAMALLPDPSFRELDARLIAGDSFVFDMASISLADV